MKALTPIQARYMQIANLFHLFTVRHISLWEKGIEDYWQARRVIRVLVKKGYLKTVKYGKQLVYGTPNRFVVRRGQDHALNLYHGLQCSETLTRLIQANPFVGVHAEQQIKKLCWSCTPEFAIGYPNDKTLMVEFCTRDNVDRGEMASKLTRYRESLDLMASDFMAEPWVLFVLDTSREEVERLVKRHKSDDPFLFVDYPTFLSTTPNKVLAAKIYFWSGDSNVHSLNSHGSEND